MPHDRSRRITNLNCFHMLVDTTALYRIIHNALFSCALYASVHRFASAITDEYALFTLALSLSFPFVLPAIVRH